MSSEAELREIALREIAEEEMDGEQQQVGPSEQMGPPQDPAKQLLQKGADELEVTGEDVTSTAHTMGMGAVEGTPFAKDTASVIETLYNTGTENFGEEFTANKQEWDKAINDAEEKNPGAFMLGDLAAGIAMPIKGVKSAMAFSGLSAASRREDRDPFEMAQSALGGMAISGAVSGAGFALKKTAHAMGFLSAASVKEGIGSMSGSSMKKVNRHINKTGTPGLSSDQKTIEFANRINNTVVNNEPLLGGALKGQSFSRTAEKAGLALKEHGNRLGKVVKELDEVLPDPVDGKQLYDSMRRRMGIDKMLASNDPSTVQLGKQYQRQIQSQFTDTVEDVTQVIIKKPMMGANGQPILDSKGAPFMTEELVDSVAKRQTWKKLSPKEIHSVKVDHSSTSSKVNSGYEKLSSAEKQRALSNDEFFDTQLNGVLNETMDEISTKAGKLRPDLDGAYRSTNRDYSDMLIVKKIAQERADAAGGGAMERLKRAFGVRGLLVAQLQQATGANVAVATAMGIGINQAISSPTTSQRMAVGLSNINKFIQANPDSSYVKRLLVAAQVSSYGKFVDNTPLQEAVSSVNAEIDLHTSPIKRNVNDIILKSDQILEVMQFHNPDMASGFREALISDDRETMRVMMDGMSKDPELKTVFEDGRGIDGRVFDEQEKAELEAELNSHDISYKQKLLHKKALLENGVIPVIEEEQERFYKPQNRDKSKPSY